MAPGAKDWGIHWDIEHTGSGETLGEGLCWREGWGLYDGAYHEQRAGLFVFRIW